MIVASGRLVEIAGRLVGNKDRRIGARAPRQSDALLLAAGKLSRIVCKPVGEADRRKLGLRARKAFGTPASSSGTATFSSAVIVGMRWKD